MTLLAHNGEKEITISPTGTILKTAISINRKKGNGNSSQSNSALTDIDEESIDKLKSRVEEELSCKSGDLYLTMYFDEEYYPFESEESKYRMEDFIAREEIEMWAYLTSLLED